MILKGEIATKQDIINEIVQKFLHSDVMTLLDSLMKNDKIDSGDLYQFIDRSCNPH